MAIMAAMALMTVQGSGREAPSLAEAAAQLGVSTQDLDEKFGVVPVDPSRGLYSVQVREGSVPAPDAGQPYRGPFSNPRIAPFGPVEPEPEKPKS
jgi:hypothetical protein